MQRQEERGFAVLLAIFAIFTLTILAVVALSVAGTDLRVAQMHRNREQVRYVAQAGLDEARNIIRQNSTDKAALAAFNDAWANYAGGNCYPLVDLATSPTVTTGGNPLGRAEACVTKDLYFSGPAPGYGMESGTTGGGARRFQMIAVDVQATSHHMDAGGTLLTLAKGRSGGMVTAVCQAPCGR